MDTFDDELDNDEIELITYVLTKVDGIGDKIATAIAVHYRTLDNFLDANFLSLGNLTDVNGRHIVRRTLVPDILNVIKNIPRGYSVKETWIRLLVREFLHKQVSMLKSLSLDSLTINPFLVRALEMNTPAEVIKFNLYQAVTRSIVTSWGFYVQEILKRSGAKEITGKEQGFDLLKVYKDITHYIQIKSSPNSKQVLKKFVKFL